MDSTDLLITLLGMISVRLPVLIAIAVGVVWLFGVPRSAVRTGALTGLVLLAATTVLGLLGSLVPIWMINAGNYDSMAGIGSILQVFHFVLSLLEAFALVLVIWALTRALRAAPARPA